MIDLHVCNLALMSIGKDELTGEADVSQRHGFVSRSLRRFGERC